MFDVDEVQASRRIFAAAQVPISWEAVDVTPVKNPDGTMSIPRAVIDSVNRNKIGLKSPLMTPGACAAKKIIFESLMHVVSLQWARASGP